MLATMRSISADAVSLVEPVGFMGAVAQRTERSREAGEPAPSQTGGSTITTTPTAKDMQIIAQNAGTSAGQVYSALIASGQIAWDKEAFPAQIEALRSVFVEGVLTTVAEAVEKGTAVDQAPRPAPAAGGRPAPAATGGDDVSCPECGGEMYDNRADKRNPKAPDFKCKSYKDGCEGVIWPPKGNRR